MNVGYAAPEMLAQKGYQGPEVDVWALGVTLYTMVCGFQPFDDPKLARVYTKVISGKYYPFPAHVSEPLQQLISQMLRVNASERSKVSDIQNHPWLRVRTE